MLLHLCFILFTGGLFPGEVFVQVGLCQGEEGSLSRGKGISLGGDLSGRPPCTVKGGRYASYWNAFFFLKYVHTVVEASVKVRYATTPLKFITHISPYTNDIEIGKLLEN